MEGYQRRLMRKEHASGWTESKKTERVRVDRRLARQRRMKDERQKKVKVKRRERILLG
jgi:hypothetical protein